MKYKATVVALSVILVAGVALYFAFLSQSGEEPEATEAPTTVVELFHPTEAPAEPNGEDQDTNGTDETENADFPAETATAAPTTAAQTTTANDGFVYPFNFPGVAPAMARIPEGDDFYLILVNRNYALPDNFTRDFLRLEVAVTHFPENIQLHETAARYFRQMYQAGRRDGVGLIPFSGYRNTQRQYTNFTNRIQRYRNQGYTHEQAVNMAAMWIKPPRCSEHETGLAIDLTNPGHWGLRQAFDQTPEFAWLMENAHNFGFILRYPRGSEAITMVNYEPWHWRFVGVENARAIRASGQVLETWLMNNY